MPRAGYVAQVREGYEAIINAIIRPPRSVYTLEELGPPAFVFRGRRFVRDDFSVTNPRGQRVECSWWQPVRGERPAPALPVVLYVHGNSSCRLAVQECLEALLAEGVTVAALDCAGSGRSEGEYVSLGYFERDDVAVVVAHLRATGGVSSVALWGRSMGAATALLHSHRDPSIAGIVLDSAFSDLRVLARELVQDGAAREGYRIPTFLINAALSFVRSTVRKRAGFDIYAVAPIRDVDRAFVPALFCAAKDDAFIKPSHSQAIFERYAGDKNIVSVDGDHNSTRPPFWHASAAIFLRSALRVPDDDAWALPARPGGGRGAGDDAPFFLSLEDSWAAADAAAGGTGGDLAAEFVDSAAAIEEELFARALAASLELAGGAPPAPAPSRLR